MSVSELDQLGYKLVFQDGLYSRGFQDGSETDLSCYYSFAYLINRLYEVINTDRVGTEETKSSIQAQRAYFAGVSSEKIYKNPEWNSWHCRLGHVNDSVLAISLKLNSLPGIAHPSSKIGINRQDECITCIHAPRPLFSSRLKSQHHGFHRHPSIKTFFLPDGGCA